MRLPSTAILDSQRFRGILAEHAGDGLPYECVRILGLLRRRVAPRPDRPDRLISHNDRSELFRRKAVQIGLYLALQNFLGHSAVALGQRLTDA